jgi:hypothetical protein
MTLYIDIYFEEFQLLFSSWFDHKLKFWAIIFKKYIKLQYKMLKDKEKLAQGEL